RGWISTRTHRAESRASLIEPQSYTRGRVPMIGAYGAGRNRCAPRGLSLGVLGLDNEPLPRSRAVGWPRGSRCPSHPTPSCPQESPGGTVRREHTPRPPVRLGGGGGQPLVPLVRPVHGRPA